MLDINCNICKQELCEPGALLFSPPENDTVEKNSYMY